jgi:nucleoside-diphosphate-sugar epimerase
MTKIIAVTGATGVQGGSIARAILKTPGWSVRAITRNPDSDAAKELASLGATVVKADIGDESSLAKAFEVSSLVVTKADLIGLFLHCTGSSCNLCLD